MKRTKSPTAMRASSKVLIIAGMALLAVTFLFPLYFMLVNAMKTKTEYYMNNFSLPTTLYLENFRVMLVDFQILRYFKNSLIVTCGSTALTLAVAVFASYAFAKLDFAGKNVAYMVVLATIFLPSQAMLIPRYVMFARYRLIGSYWSVILLYLASSTPGAIMLLRASFIGIPNDLIESAKIDGAGYFRIVFTLIVPLSLAALSIVTINHFISHWNDLLTPMLFLGGEDTQTVMVALNNLVDRNGGLPTRQLTGLLLSVLPTVLLYLALQKYMIKGIMVGSVKG